MQSLKSVIYLFLVLFPTCLWSQHETNPYLDIRWGGPSSLYRIPGPSIETGILFSPHIGIGVRYEMEPLLDYYHHGFGIHLRISSQTKKGTGWHLSTSMGKGYEVRSQKQRSYGNNEKKGYLFSEISIGRHIHPRIIFSSGVRAITEFRDLPARTEPRHAKLLISKFTFLIGKPSQSVSPNSAKLNQQSYFFGIYSVNTRFFDSFRVNGMINMGIGWKLLPQVGLGASLILNEGLGVRGIQGGRNLDKFTGIGAHLFLRKEPFWGIIEVGAANNIVIGRQNGIALEHFTFRQHSRATTFYGRIGAGIFLGKDLLAQVSFLIAPTVYGDSQFQGRPPVIGSGTRFLEQNDVYFSYSDLNIGLGFLLE